jgi:hypothetical protein
LNKTREGGSSGVGLGLGGKETRVGSGLDRVRASGHESVQNFIKKKRFKIKIEAWVMFFFLNNQTCLGRD